MLEVLKIRNIAIIDSTEIHFKSGLNIITGETGAGKSIVLDAISLLLGSRASTELIRAGCTEALIDGLFCIKEIPWIIARLEKHGLSGENNELLIKRIVHRGGKHRIYINGELATLSILQNICEGLIDLCGQHEHQSLLKSSVQLDLLDRYGGLSEQVKFFTIQLNQIKALQKEALYLQETDQQRLKKSDFLSFQINELREMNLNPGEDERLQEEKRLLQSAEHRVQIAESARTFLESEDTGVVNSLKASLQKLRSLSNLDPKASELETALERISLETEEVCRGLNTYLNSIELNSERLQLVQDRISKLAIIRRKYGNSIETILNQLQDLEAELFAMGSINERLGKVNAELAEFEHLIKEVANDLFKARQKIQLVLSESVTEELRELRMSEAKFLIDITHKEDFRNWTNSADSVQYLIQTNRGEPPRPLGKIASGGELSRLMLAIRRVIADRGGIGVYLFDEIDAGIGGQTAFEVGKKLKSVASYNQVICITHLPQVASFADHHLTVEKSFSANRTITKISELNFASRKKELARMLGGDSITRKSLETASELLASARAAP